MPRFANHITVPDGPGEVWTFQYSRAELLTASKRRARWHRGRLAHWRKEFAKLRKKLPSTITIENQEYMNKAASNSSYGRAELHIEPELTKKFHLCVQKVTEHQRFAEEFERWVAVFSHDRDRTAVSFGCGILDIKYFGLHDAARYTAAKEKDTPEDEL